MATATLGLLTYTSISTAESTTGWTTFDTLDTDIKKEGSNGITGTFRADLTAGHYDNGSAPATAASKHIRMWVNTTNVPYMETTANGGYEFYMYDGSTTEYYTIFSLDDYYGGWFNMVIDCDLFTTLTLANVQRWGIRVNHTTNAKNVDNMWVDYIRYLDGYYITGGTSGDKVRLINVSTADRGTTTLYGYGIVDEVEGVYLGYGTLQLGNGATTTYFEMNGDVLVFTDQPVADGLFAINGNGSGADILITGSTIKSAGSAANTRFDFDMVTGSPSSVVVTNNVFQRGGVFTFTSGQTVTGNSFTDCQQIIAAGADFTASKVYQYEGTADTAALVWNVATDTDGYLDEMSFTKGTASTHAIELGTASPTSVILNDIVFSGYNATNGQTDSTILVSRTSGTVTINLVGCSGNISYKSAGATVVLVVNPVTLEVTVKNSSGSVIQGARVYVQVADGSNFIYNATISSLTFSAGTVTATHSAVHNLSTGATVLIAGATEPEYNGQHDITVTSTTAYTYTIAGTPSSPATGSPVATLVLIEDTTDALGQVSDTRSYSADQPITGRVRKSSSSPYYKTAAIAGTVNSTAGLDLTVQMVSDE